MTKIKTAKLSADGYFVKVTDTNGISRNFYPADIQLATTCSNPAKSVTKLMTLPNLVLSKQQLNEQALRVSIGNSIRHLRSIAQSNPNSLATMVIQVVNRIMQESECNDNSGRHMHLRRAAAILSNIQLGDL